MGKNKTIYFRTGIAERIEGLDVGPLVNDLLEAHFIKQDASNSVANMKVDAAGPGPVVAKEIPQAPPKKITAEPAAPADDDPERPCCANKAPCQHWSWDGDNGVWRNSLSGRTREP